MVTVELSKDSVGTVMVGTRSPRDSLWKMTGRRHDQDWGHCSEGPTSEKSKHRVKRRAQEVVGQILIKAWRVHPGTRK